MDIYPERFKELTKTDTSGFNEYVKLPIPIKAKAMNKPFRVNTLEGDYKQGKSGDYLMVGIDGELYICDKDIFDRSYRAI